MERTQIVTRIPDRKKLRRDYVERKAGAYASGMVCSVMFVPCTLVAATFLVAAIGLFGCAIFHGLREEDFASYIWGAMGSVVGAGVFGVYARIFCVGIQEARKSARVPYVPPASAHTLPAEEVLVRASDAPLIVHSEVLLRAAQGQETPQEELLRVVIEGDSGL
jgi:hypothetical protein